MRTVPVAALVLCLASAAPALAQQETPAAVAERLGDRIDSSAASGDGVQAGHATAVVNAPFDRVVEAVTTYGDYASFMPHFTASRVLSSRGSSALVYLQAAAFHDTIVMWANLRIRPRRATGDTQVFEARMVEGNVEQFYARWEVSPLDDGAKALVTFDLLIEPDLPLPDGVVTDENVRNAGRVLSRLRDWVRRRGARSETTSSTARNP